MSETDLRVAPGVSIGDALSYRGRTVHFVGTPDGRQYRLGAAEVRVLELLDQVPAATAQAHEDSVLPPAATALLQRFEALGLVTDITSPRAQRRDEPAATRVRNPRVLQSGWSGRLVIADPGAALGRLDGRIRRGTWAAAAATLGLAAIVTVALVVVLSGRLLDEFLSAPRTAGEIAIVIATLAVSLAVHELAHGFASVHVGGDATEIGLRWRPPFAAFYCRTDGIRRVHGRGRRALIALAGPGVVLGLTLPLVIVWALAPGAATAHTVLPWLIVALTVSSVVNLVPFPGFDGYVALTHALRHADLAGDSMAWIRGDKSATTSARVYGVVTGAVLAALAVGLVSLWFVTLASWVGTASSALILIAEAAVIVIFVRVLRQWRRPAAAPAAAAPRDTDQRDTAPRDSAPRPSEQGDAS